MYTTGKFFHAALALACMVMATAVSGNPQGDETNEPVMAQPEPYTDIPTQVLGTPLLAPEALAQFYRNRKSRLAWTDPDQWQQLIAAIADAGDDGLSPLDYHWDLLSELEQRNPEQIPPELLADLDLVFSDAFLVFASHLQGGKVNPRTLDPEWHVTRRQQELTDLLDMALASGNITSALNSLRPSFPAYTRLVQARRDMMQWIDEPWDMLPDGPSIRPGDSDPRIPSIRHRLILLGDLQKPARAPAEPETYTDLMVTAVPLFQARHGLEPDGIIGRDTLTALNMMPVERIRQIDASLERWRWLPRNLGDRFVIVNIAGYELRMIDHGREVLRKRVIVGQPYRQTPLFNDRIRYLVINPTWTVPRSLMIHDQLPRIIRDPGYLERMKIQVFRGWGKDRVQVDPATIDWASLSVNNFPYQLIQQPGPRNALGRIKFMFPNKHAIYLHDTPSQGLFSNNERSASSGCIRVEQPFELADALLAGDPQWSPQTLRKVLDSGESRKAVLQTPVPVYLQYWTAWIDDAGLRQFRTDIYNRDARLLARLYSTPAEAGYPVPRATGSATPGNPGQSASAGTILMEDKSIY